MTLISTEEELQERIKEQRCLYKIVKLLLAGGSADQILQHLMLAVKEGWRFCDEAIVELHVNTIYMLSDPLPNETICQQSRINLSETTNSYIKIHYDAAKYKQQDFLEGEQDLLQAVASQIALFYENQLVKEQIAQLQSDLRRVDRLSILGEITAGIAHELNTPLGNILGFAELIKTRSTDKQIIQDIDKVINASIFSREIVKKLMFFSCEMPYNAKSIAIIPIVDQALKFLEPNFAKAGLTYHFEFKNKDLQAQIDNVQFTQVLFNLLVNAIYVSPMGSQISIVIDNNDQFYFIEIADEGIGIPQSIQERIFEPFFTTKPFGEGTGLGLSVVHGIIKSHRGEITFFANQPKGTVFRITLPIKNQLLN